MSDVAYPNCSLCCCPRTAPPTGRNSVVEKIVVGEDDGGNDGPREKVGSFEGVIVGVDEGKRLGVAVGVYDGIVEGAKVGCSDGSTDGNSVGSKVGTTDGSMLGDAVGRKLGSGVDGEALSDGV